MKKNISVVDLFCGVGGLTHGLIKAGIKVNAGIDIDKTSRFAFEENNNVPFVEKDIKTLTAKELKALYPDNHIKVLVGCAPCQPFSTHTQKNKNRKDDGKWDLLSEFGRLVEGVKPEIVSMENVPKIKRETVFKNFVKKLEGLKYFVSWKSVYCPDYGIPQTRLRVVLLASKFGPIELFKKTHSRENHPTVKSFIGGLETIRDGGVSKKDELHRAGFLTDINKRRIRQSKPGGTWLDWDEELRAKCHQKVSGATYTAVYARMEWKKPGPTITTQFYRFGTGRFGHPVQDRALSLREGALLQTFPKDYKFVAPGKPVLFRHIGTHIGNAVPVRLGTIIGKSIKKHLEAL